MPAEPVSPIEKVASDGNIALGFLYPSPPGASMSSGLNPVVPWDRIQA
jgi:hypothetical protein